MLLVVFGRARQGSYCDNRGVSGGRHLLVFLAGSVAVRKVEDDPRGPTRAVLDLRGEFWFLVGLFWCFVVSCRVVRVL